MSKQGHYGFPCVSDPNDFSPDYESCSPAEIEAHKQACATFGTPEYQQPKGCTTDYDESGQFVRHVLRTSWGIGVNTVTVCDECGEPCDTVTVCHECGGPEFCEVCWPNHPCNAQEG